jgi:hypothetical protein
VSQARGEMKIKDTRKRRREREATYKASFRYAKLNPSVPSAKASSAISGKLTSDLMLEASLFCQKQAYARRSGVEGFGKLLQEG